jgi:general secretion pathway protein L
MNVASGFITYLPVTASTPLPYWRIEDGVIVARGLVQLTVDNAPVFPDASGLFVMALVPAAHAIVRWIDMEGVPARQAETAARLRFLDDALQPNDQLHTAAISNGDGPVMIAGISAQLLQSGLDRLAAQGLNPDAIMPSGLVIPSAAGDLLRASFANDIVLRGEQLILPDEPKLVAAMMGGAMPRDISEAEADAALIAAMAAPPLNLRTGVFAKRVVRGVILPAQYKILMALLLAGLCFSLLLAIVTWAKFSLAAQREDALSLTLARKIVPAAGNAAEAQNLLNRELIRRGAGGRQVTVTASALYAIIQGVEAVSLRDMRNNGDGILAFTLIANNVDAINQALLIMQQQGYKVTATPRQEASGLAAADISMRIPQAP